MKTLVVLLSLFCIVSGEGCPAPGPCFGEIMKQHTCITQYVQNQTKNNMEQLKEFGQASLNCFNESGVQGVCSPPPRPTGQQPPPQNGSPAQFASCLNGTKRVFATCFKSALGIPADCHPPASQADQQKQMGLANNLHGHFFHISPAEAKKQVLASCGGNQKAAKKLETCVSNVAKPYMQAIVQTMIPAILLCNAKNVCSEMAPLSADCQAKAEQGRQAFCQCIPPAINYIKNETQCANLRAAFANSTMGHGSPEDKAQQAGHETSQGQHDMPNHPQMPMNFCQNGANPCQQLKEKLQKLHAAYSAKQG